jgi:hypothetical protein
MAESVSAAKQQADRARIPLVVAVAETHQDVRTLARNAGALRGNAVVLSVPRTAAQDLQFLNQASNTEVVPRSHVFPPAANGGRMQPQNIIQEVEQYTPFWVRLAADMDNPANTSEITEVIQSFGVAETAWNQALSSNSNVRRPATATSNNNNSTNSSPVVQQQQQPVVAPKPVVVAPTTAPKPQQPQPVSQDDGNPTPVIRVVPKVHIRLHHSAPSSAGELPFVPPQPRNLGLPQIRPVIAKIAEKSFGNNFFFIEKDSNVRVRLDNEHALVAQDVCHGGDLYIAPFVQTAPVSSSAPVSSKPAENTATTTAPRVSPAATTSSSAKLRMKITFPDESSEVVSNFTTESTAEEVKKYIQTKLGEGRNFFIQLPQRRIKDDEMNQTLRQLNVTGSVAIRIYDVDLMRQRADQYDQEVKTGVSEEGGVDSGAAPTTNTTTTTAGAGGLMSSILSRFSGSGSAPPPPPPTPAPGGANRPPPRSMAELRQQQEEEEKKKKEASNKKGPNEFYGGSGTNTQAPDGDE